MKQLRFVTATSLFDGHDVSINIIRRLLQAKGVEVIHLGHNRSAKEVAEAALSENVNGVALSSYQGGHMEYFTYIRELLDKNGGEKIKIFGGGGGVITLEEINELEEKGIEKIYSPEDGTTLGLEGIIDDMIKRATWSTTENTDYSILKNRKLSSLEIGNVITFIEEKGSFPWKLETTTSDNIPTFGITGTGGAGKSSLIDEILLRLITYYPNKKMALISVDPTKKRTKGALLGDRIRLSNSSNDNFYICSLATRDSHSELSPQIKKVIEFLKTQEFNLILVETSGIGQAADEITNITDKCLYVMTPEFGAQTQLEKIEMLESADFIAINKFEKPRSEDALRDVRKQYRRNKNLFSTDINGGTPDDKLPVFGTIASQYNDEGVNALFYDIIKSLDFSVSEDLEKLSKNKIPKVKSTIIAPDRSQYLSDIAKTIRTYNANVRETEVLIENYENVKNASNILNNTLEPQAQELKKKIPQTIFEEIKEFDKRVDDYRSGTYSYTVRGKEFKVPTKYQSLTQLNISKIGIPKTFYSLRHKYNFLMTQNLPGFFPFAAGVFPFKRSNEDPKRMFAGEGGPAKTNKRFHYLSKDDDAKRLSTAFDSVTLYGEDPQERPDIFGKIGESGVSICTLQDMQTLFKGFDLANPMTSVSMTINGPAPILLAMFMNTACKQNLNDDDFFNTQKRLEVMKQVRGTVQADILKEDQAQNTCIFSLPFALRMIGDVQEYFSKNKIKNYFTISISGYHIAEAGANPISQLAFTLANGFTYVEYFLSRGIPIDEFCENLSFFFSNGLDPEYSVMGRVARKIWAITMRDKYGASLKSQKLKYHIQTSGRSLHAQEINFNDIRTTLQAFLALSENCNSLHTNAYDEAITTPTEESVRRAMAIQMIINKEFGLNKSDNPMQGSFIYDELTDLVEEAVLNEFDTISAKGGVLGAMESMYQRAKIQEESLYYESLKNTGELPIVGVNTYLNPNQDQVIPTDIELSRSTNEEKQDQINRLNDFKNKNSSKSTQALEKLKETALGGGNIFEELLSTVNYCSLGQITEVLYHVGGKYRRNM